MNKVPLILKNNNNLIGSGKATITIVIIFILIIVIVIIFIVISSSSSEEENIISDTDPSISNNDSLTPTPKTTPTPTPIYSGAVTVYENEAYGGNSATLVDVGTYNISDLDNLGISNDAISSIKVNSGYQATLYSDDNLSGSSQVYDVDTDLTDIFNNVISSIKVTKESSYAIVYKNTDYTGDSILLPIGNYNIDDISALNDAISSIKLVGNIKVSIFTDSDYSGSSKTYTLSIADLSDDSINDTISSIKVKSDEHGPVIVYENQAYGGNSATLVDVGTYNISDLDNLGISNDAISSIEVKSGYQATLYSDDNLSGSSQVYDIDTDLTDIFNDVISSIKVTKESSYAIVYKNTDYTGDSILLPIGNYNIDIISALNDAISSIKLVGNIKVTIYTDSDYSGSSKTYTSSIADLRDDSMNDSLSSIKVENA